MKKELNCLGIYGLMVAFLAFSMYLRGFVCLFCYSLKSLQH